MKIPFGFSEYNWLHYTKRQVILCAAKSSIFSALLSFMKSSVGCFNSGGSEVLGWKPV